MASAPILSFRDATDPTAVVSQINYAQSTLGTDFLPVLQGEESVEQKFRIYNNYGAASGIATAFNLYVTVYDGSGVASHTATKRVTSQSWLRVYETGFGESQGAPAVYTAWEGSDTAIGGANVYYPAVGSDGLFSEQIRAGSDTNGVGFVELGSYIQLPAAVQSTIWNFAISVQYEWVS